MKTNATFCPCCAHCPKDKQSLFCGILFTLLRPTSGASQPSWHETGLAMTQLGLTASAILAGRSTRMKRYRFWCASLNQIEAVFGLWEYQIGTFGQLAHFSRCLDCLYSLQLSKSEKPSEVASDLQFQPANMLIAILELNLHKP
jgi:hypothetical protein